MPIPPREGYKGNVDNPSAEHGNCSVSVNGYGSIQIKEEPEAPQGFSGFASRQGSPELQQSRPDWAESSVLQKPGERVKEHPGPEAVPGGAPLGPPVRDGRVCREEGHSRGPGALASSSGLAAGPALLLAGPQFAHQ